MKVFMVWCGGLVVLLPEWSFDRFSLCSWPCWKWPDRLLSELEHGDFSRWWWLTKKICWYLTSTLIFKSYNCFWSLQLYGMIWSCWSLLPQFSKMIGVGDRGACLQCSGRRALPCPDASTQRWLTWHCSGWQGCSHEEDDTDLSSKRANNKCCGANCISGRGVFFFSFFFGGGKKINCGIFPARVGGNVLSGSLLMGMAWILY